MRKIDKLSSIWFFLRLPLFAAVGLFACFTGEAEAESYPLRVIRDDATGGDCVLIGTWNGTTRTCTLTANADISILIDSDYVTLDGNGYVITGSGPAEGGGSGGAGDGVLVTGRTGVAVTNLTVRRFDFGIRAQDSNDVTITGNSVYNNAWSGISVNNSSGTSVAANTVANLNMDTGIFVGFGATGNSIVENQVYSTERGIFLYNQSNDNYISINTLDDAGWGVSVFSSIGNAISSNSIGSGQIGVLLSSMASSTTVSGNVISSNSTGLKVEGASNNDIYSNELTGNSIQATVLSSIGNDFNLPAPNGGNLWSDYDTADEGCYDSDADGFCDTPYSFDGGVDNLPVSSGSLQYTSHTLHDDATGGDCTLIGSWDDTSKTCTLTGDHSGSLLIESDNITLDGGGFTVTGSGPPGGGGSGEAGDGITVSGRANVTVTNLTVRQFAFGVRLLNSTAITVSGISVQNNSWAGIAVQGTSNSLIDANDVRNLDLDTGIFLGFSSTGNTVSDNTIQATERAIFLYDQAQSNTLTGNMIAGNNWGISIYGSSGNSAAGNEIRDGVLGVNLQDGAFDNMLTINTLSNNETGARLVGVLGNTFYGNDFVDNTTQASVSGGGGNLFNLDTPTGGNRWSNYDTAAEGCVDSDSDGFCDTPYDFGGGIDNLPLSSETTSLEAVILDDPGGGDCSAIGVWDDASKTCALTGDYFGNLVIASDGITLDGGGYRVTGSGPSEGGGNGGAGTGIMVEEQTGVTITNVTVRQFDFGIKLYNSTAATVSSVKSYNNAWAGISIHGTTDSLIEANHVSNQNADTGIFAGFSASNNTFSGNVVSGTERAIFLHDNSNSNTISQNTISNGGLGISLNGSLENVIFHNGVTDGLTGVYLFGGANRNTVQGNFLNYNDMGALVESSNGNSFFRNDFIGNDTQASVNSGNNNSFSRPAPNGGNHWDNFDTIAEGCSNVTNDSFCDSPFHINGAVDNLPITRDRRIISTPITIRNDATGGDCTSVGAWDPDTLTCTLGSDRNGNFIIEDDDITFDGGGQTLTGSGPVEGGGPGGAGVAIRISGHSGITIKNLTIERYDYGIQMHSADNNTITNVTTFNHAWAGISLSWSSNNLITGNHLSNLNLDSAICIGYQSNNNTISDNYMANHERGVYYHDFSSGNVTTGNTMVNNVSSFTMIWLSNNNTFTSNTVTGGTYPFEIYDYSVGTNIRSNVFSNNVFGIYISEGMDTIVSSNDFIDNETQLFAGAGDGNIYNLPYPLGGNYWSDFDTQAEGCSDSGGDGFCDTPYVFDNGVDYMPKVAPAY